MSDPNTFSERGQDPYADIPTDADAFLRWGASLTHDDGYRYELSGGKVTRMMIKISRAHWRVSTNILAELLMLLDRTRFEAGPAEFGVKTGVGVRYPDVSVDKRSDQLKGLACEAPILIVEVLSPSSVAVDMTTKQREYTAIPSLQTYLVCSQDEPRAWVWRRQPNGTWPVDAEEIVGRDASIPIGGLEAELSMAAIFRDIPDAPTA
jgi:Uma2 family endonuclease